MPLLILFIIAVTVLGGFLVGPLSVRVYATILMMAYLVVRWNKNQSALTNYKPVAIYIFFLFVCFVTKLMSQSMSPYQLNELAPFVKSLFSVFLVALVAYIAISQCVTKSSDLGKIILALLAVGLFNNIITILQGNGSTAALALGVSINPLNDEMADFFSRRFNDPDYDGRLILPGIFGHGVSNGYFTACLGILPICLYSQKKLIVKIIGIILSLLSIWAAYLVQERSGMFMLLVGTLWGWWKYSGLWCRRVIPVLVILAIALYFDAILGMFNEDNLGRFTKTFDYGEDREELVRNATEFLSTNWLWGGDVQFSVFYGITPHNFILHAIIYGGIFGALIIFYLFYYMLRDCIKLLWHSNVCSSMAFVLAVSLSIYLFNGLVHSGSLITGDVLIWILYAMLLKSIYFDNKEQTAGIQTINEPS